MTHIFGPVPSRRLGRSLGVDIVPFKTCPYDCIYCQLGQTTNKTIQRKQWVPLDDVVDELKTKWTTKPDYITLSGSGEPTLYSKMGELIDRIKEMAPVPVAVLTNGSLLWQQEVRDQLRHADLVIPSLDAGNEAMFRTVNRPHENITFEKMLQGLIDFRHEFQGQYWLEVFLLDDLNTHDVELREIVQSVRLIKPERIQLNTVTRPPVEKSALAVKPQKLKSIAALFDPPAEVIADFRGVHDHCDFKAGQEDILDLLRRRPCSIDDIADGLKVHRNEAIKYLEELSVQNRIETIPISDKLYYKATDRVIGSEP